MPAQKISGEYGGPRGTGIFAGVSESTVLCDFNSDGPFDWLRRISDAHATFSPVSAVQELWAEDFSDFGGPTLRMVKDRR